ncbi:hypothetical protein [Coriobacterium glomerans]|nr:hypothetical protein [Coriobacterium glomerans]
MVIIEGIGNTIMLVLIGFALTAGLSVDIGPRYFYIVMNGWVFALVAYLICYMIILLRENRRQGAPFSRLLFGLQLHADVDEREALISCRAGRIAYLAVIVNAGVDLWLLAVARIATAASLITLDAYAFGCWLIIIMCIVANLSYLIAWSHAYLR